jgi:hypothetical protein
LDKNYDFLLLIYTEFEEYDEENDKNEELLTPDIKRTLFINKVAQIIEKTIPTIKIGKLDVDKNDINKELFPNIHTSFQFLGMNKKTKPRIFNGDWNCANMVNFLIENSSINIQDEIQKEVLKNANSCDQESILDDVLSLNF